MGKKDNILSKNLNANRSRKILNIDYFERFKKSHPVTYRRILKSMDEYGDWRYEQGLKTK